MARRYRRRRYRSRRRSPPRVGSSASERARAFVLREFFKLDQSTLNRVIQLYGREYKEGARKYFEATFDKWRKGEVRPRRETQDRILHCVPRFLPTAKQFKLLSFYLPEYLSQLAAASHVQHLTIAAVPTAFANASKRCRESEPKLDWFVRGVFSEEEIAAFADVVRYTVLGRLHRSYTAVRLDLATATSYFAGLDAKITLRYRVEELGVEIHLDGVVPTLPESAFDLPPMPALIGRNQREYERILVEHHRDMIVEQKAQDGRHAVVQLDLSILKNAVHSISKAESMESSFQARGAGGTFEGSICRKNLPALKAQSHARIGLAVLGTLGLVGGIAAAFTVEELAGLAVCGIFPVLAVVPALWSWAMEKHREVHDYERGQATRFTEGRR